MRNLIKAGILTLVLVVPVLVFLFLKGFGKNHYTLPYYHPESVSAEGDTIFSKIPNGLGHPGGIAIFSLIEMPCEAACQRQMAQLTRIQDAFAGEENVRLYTYLVSGDGSANAQPLMSDYRVNSEFWEFRKTDPGEVENSLIPSLRLGYWPNGAKVPETLNKLVLTDGQGHFRGYYDGQVQEDVDRLIIEVKLLLQQ